jgi:hypothetical protein
LSSYLLSKDGNITYTRVISPVVLYGCETWLLTLGKECRLRLFENMVLRTVFEPKREEVAGGWRSFITCTLHFTHNY